LTYRPVGNAKPTDEWRNIKADTARAIARHARTAVVPVPRRRPELRVIP
jgi:hypothetical protein